MQIRLGLGLVSDNMPNVSVSSRSRTHASRVSSRSRPERSRAHPWFAETVKRVETGYWTQNKLSSELNLFCVQFIKFIGRSLCLVMEDLQDVCWSLEVVIR